MVGQFHVSAFLPVILSDLHEVTALACSIRSGVPNSETIIAYCRITMASTKTYVVDHLDPECGPWSTLEYIAIAKESTDAGAQFCLLSASHDLDVPESLSTARGFNLEYRSVEEIYRDSKDRVCLLDPAAKEELSPNDAWKFDVFVFGGILGTEPALNYESSDDQYIGEG